jgi:hypothetical protein
VNRVVIADEVERIVRPSLDRPVISADLVLRLQKYRDPGRVPPAVRRIIEAMAAEATRLAALEAVVWRGAVTAVDPLGEVTLDGRHRFHSRTLARLLGRSTEAMVFVMTVGPAIEERAQALLEAKLYVEALLVDTAAWAAIELGKQELRRRLLDAERARGRSLTARLGPGHSDWAVDEQAALFGVFGGTPLPVTVNESACMLPRKSISGIFGVVAPVPA